MFAALLPPLVLVIFSCITVEGSSSVSPAIMTYDSQTATDVTPSATENTTTSTEIMTASTDETTSSSDTTSLNTSNTFPTTHTGNTTPSTHADNTSATTHTGSTTPSTHADNTSATTHTGSTTPSTHADNTSATTHTGSTTPSTHADNTSATTHTGSTTPSTHANNTSATTHTGSTTPSTHTVNTSATTHTGSTNPVPPTGNASAPHTDTTVPVTHNDSNTNEPTAPTTTFIMSTVTSPSSVVTEPERTPAETTKKGTVLPPAPSTGKPSGGTTIPASPQSDETLTSAQRTGIIIFVCMVVLIALITLGVIIITWRRRYKATISQAIDLRSIVNHRPNNARISLHEAVLDDDSLAETDVTTVGKPRADDGSEDKPKDTNPSPIMRNKSFPTTAFANPTYSFDVIDKRRPFSTFEGDVSQDSRSSSTYAKGNNSRVRHSSADDILSKSLKKSRLSMTSVASLAQSLSLCGLEYFTHEEEVDKMSFAGAMECDPSIGESNGEVAESEGGVNGYAENYEGQNATFYMQ